MTLCTRCQRLLLLFVLLLRTQYVTSGRRRRTWATTSDLNNPDLAPTPTFIDGPSKVTFRQGQKARLDCGINNLESKKVEWRRRSDPHPLTIDVQRFVRDPRVSVVHEPLSPLWTLTINDVRPQDAGVYQCTVVARTGGLTREVTLHVKRGKPKSNVKSGIKITGNTFVERRHTLTLMCNATGDGESPEDIDWFHEGQKLDTGEGDRVTINKKVSLTERTIHSVLTVRHVVMADKGHYVCRTSDLQIASVRVDVLNADSSNVKRGTEKDASTLQTGAHSSRSGSTARGAGGGGALIVAALLVASVARGGL